MSSCLVIRDNDNIFMASDTAMSYFSENLPIRFNNNLRKIFKIGESLIFCSGKLDVVENILSIINKDGFFIFENISKFLKEIKKNNLESFFDAEIIILEDGRIFQMSEYNNYDVIEHPIPKNNEIYIMTAGISTKVLSKVAEKFLLEGVNVIETIRKSMNSIVSEQVGGFLDIWSYKNRKIKNEVFEKMEDCFSVSLDENKELFLIAAEVIVGTLLAGTQLLITNSGGTFSVDANGATLIDASFTLDNSVSRITLDPTVGILVQKKDYSASSITASGNTTAVGSSVSSLSWSHTVTSASNRLLIVTISSAKSGVPSTTSVSFGGTALTRLGGLQASNNMSEIWYLKNPAIGTATIAIVCSSGTYIEAGATNYNNVDQTTTFQTLATGSGTSTTPSISVTSATNNLVIDSLSYNNGSSNFSVGAGQTQIYHVSSDGAWKGSSSYESGATSVTMSWTGSSVFWILVGVSLIKSTSSYTLVDSFYLDVNGNAIFAGDISAATGTFSGDLNAAGGTFAGDITAATGTFSGTISAYSGNIGVWQIDNDGIYDIYGNGQLRSYGSGGAYDFQIGSLVVVKGATRYHKYNGDVFEWYTTPSTGYTWIETDALWINGNQAVSATFNPNSITSMTFVHGLLAAYS